MTHASVFSGIGGPEVAAAMLGWENLFHCEINPFGRAVLEYWFPNSKSYEDITTTDFSEWAGKVNVLTGGFPCQPFSYAGQRRGEKDDRYLWPFMHRCINQVRPDWVVCENVAGILTMVEQGDVTEMAVEKSLFGEGGTLHRYRLAETFTLERICNDLESDGYAVQAVVIPACAVNAPHRRDRVFIIGCRNDSTNPVSRGEGTPRKGDGTESNGRNQDKLTEQRRATTQRDNRLHAVLRPVADTTGNGGDRIATGESGQAARQDGQLDAESAINGSVLPRTSSDPQGDSRLFEVPAQRSGIRQQISGDERRAEVHDGFGGLGSKRASTNPDVHRRGEVDEHLEPKLADGAEPVGNGRERDAADTSSERPQTGHRGRETGETSRDASSWYRGSYSDIAGCGRWDTFPTVSPVHRGNDGIPFPLDDITISPSKWRTESLKAYGNAIVPQVMYEIFKAIEDVTNNKNKQQ